MFKEMDVFYGISHTKSWFKLLNMAFVNRWINKRKASSCFFGIFVSRMKTLNWKLKVTEVINMKVMECRSGVLQTGVSTSEDDTIPSDDAFGYLIFFINTGRTMKSACRDRKLIVTIMLPLNYFNFGCVFQAGKICHAGKTTFSRQDKFSNIKKINLICFQAIYMCVYL